MVEQNLSENYFCFVYLSFVVRIGYAYVASDKLKIDKHLHKNMTFKTFSVLYAQCFIRKLDRALSNG